MAGERRNIAIVDWYSEAQLVEDPYYLYLFNAVEKTCLQRGLNTFKVVRLDSGYTASVNLKADGMPAIRDSIGLVPIGFSFVFSKRPLHSKRIQYHNLIMIADFHVRCNSRAKRVKFSALVYKKGGAPYNGKVCSRYPQFWEAVS